MKESIRINKEGTHLTVSYNFTEGWHGDDITPSTGPVIEIINVTYMDVDITPVIEMFDYFAEVEELVYMELEKNGIL